MIKTPILFLLLTGIISCKKSKEQIWSTYPNGNVHKKFIFDNFLNKDTTGLALVFFIDGRLEATGRLNSGKRDGQWVLYHPDGSLKWDGNFKKGKLNGEVFWRDLHGNWGRTNYVNGIKEGKSLQFAASLSENNDTTYFYKRGQFRNNKPDGLWQRTDINGVVLVENTFVDGKITGYFTNRYQNGNIKLKGDLNINANGDNKFDYFNERGKKMKLNSYEIEIVEP